jgi:hypothetical protein
MPDHVETLSVPAAGDLLQLVGRVDDALAGGAGDQVEDGDLVAPLA